MPENTTPDQPQHPGSETAPIGAASGNRWEAAAHEAAAPEAAAHEAAAPEAAPPVPPADQPPAPPVPPAGDAGPAQPGEPAKAGRFTRPGLRAVLAGTAAAALVLVGASAFAVGRVTADGDGGRHGEQFQVDQQWHDGPPPGAPAPGTVPGAPGDDDHGYDSDDDSDDDSFGGQSE